MEVTTEPQSSFLYGDREYKHIFGSYFLGILLAIPLDFLNKIAFVAIYKYKVD